VMLLPGNTALGLLDAEQGHSAAWKSTRDVKVKPADSGETFLVGWDEAFNVIAGASLRATYPTVPSGTYTFRAIAMGDESEIATSHLAFDLKVRQPFWQSAWFLPLISGAGLVGIGLVVFGGYRRRARHRLAELKLRHAVEQDRARIARDMHDDLGTRVTVLNLAAAFVRRAIDIDQERARQQLVRMESAARDLASAMEGLVWAIDPANDSLDDLATHLAAVAQEMFRDSGIRLRIVIPDVLPQVGLRPDFRHHFALGVKEALHNVLKHAGPCTVVFQLFTANGWLVAVVEDTGAGFDFSRPQEGNGLRNLKARFDELAGTCLIESNLGAGTCVTIRCPLAKPYH
jgi:signal transduction histidine kinase